MDENIKFVFVASQLSTSVRFMDLKDDSRVIYLNGFSKSIHNPILHFIKCAHLSTKINKHINLPCKWIWGNNLKSVDWKNNTTYYIIFSQGAIYPAKLSYLRELQRQYSIHYIIYLHDFFDSKYAKIARYYIENFDFDYIFSFDPFDCKKYGFNYELLPYSKLPIYKSTPSTEKSFDLYYVGTDRGRLELLHRIYDYSRANDVSSIFRVSEVSTADTKYSGIIYNDFIEYEQVVCEAKCCNCVLELMADGQSGSTLRYYEAVCYNLKLLTNNRNVLNMPFYNPNYIHIFSSPEDINWEWVKERIPVDYHYDGCFSPTHLLDRIIELEQQKEGR